MNTRKVLLLFITLVTVFPFLKAEETISLEECRRRAIEHNKQLQIAQQRVEQAKYERKSAFANYLPDLSFTGAYMYNQRNIALIDASHIPPLVEVLIPRNLYTLDIHNVYVGALTLTQPIFMGGKIVAYNQITKYAEELAKAKQNMAVQEVIVRTDEVYWQIVSLTYKEKLADQYVALLTKLSGDVQALIDEGVATKADALSVAVKLNEAELTYNKVQNGIALSKMLLCQITGMELDSRFQLQDEGILDISDDGDSMPLTVDQALGNRIELKSLDLAAKIYKRKERVVMSEMLPSVALMGNYIGMNPHAFNGFKNEFSGMWNVGVVVRVPIFHFGKEYNHLRAARAETKIISLERDEAREKIELQIKQAYFKINEAQAFHSMTSKALDKANENLLHAEEGYKEGVLTLTNVVEAQTAWLKANSENIDADIERKLSHLYLKRAVGTLTESK